MGRWCVQTLATCERTVHPLVYFSPYVYSTLLSFFLAVFIFLLVSMICQCRIECRRENLILYVFTSFRTFESTEKAVVSFLILLSLSYKYTVTSLLHKFTTSASLTTCHLINALKLATQFWDKWWILYQCLVVCLYWIISLYIFFSSML